MLSYIEVAYLQFFRDAWTYRTVWVPVLPGGRSCAMAAAAVESWLPMAAVLCEPPVSPYQWPLLWTFYLHSLLDLHFWYGSCLLKNHELCFDFTKSL